MNTKKVLSFGELLLRLQSESAHFFADEENSLRLFAGGSEANVAVALAQLGVSAEYMTAIPDQNSLAKEALAEIQKQGVDTQKTIYKGDRLGSYFLQSKNGLTKGEVIYDRAFSGFSQLSEEDLDMDTIFRDVSWFHWTAISPGLSADMASLLHLLLNEAEKRGVFISVDLNYRSKLWKYGKKPSEIVPSLVKKCDVVMGNVWANHIFFEAPLSADLQRDTQKEVYFEEAIQSAKFIFDNFPKCKHIAHTFRFMDNEKHNLLYGTYHTPNGDYLSTSYETHELIDRIGSGDAFMAGLIYGIIKGEKGQNIVEKATQTGFAKLFIEGDFGIKK